MKVIIVSPIGEQDTQFWRKYGPFRSESEAAVALMENGWVFDRDLGYWIGNGIYHDSDPNNTMVPANLEARISNELDLRSPDDLPKLAKQMTAQPSR